MRTNLGTKWQPVGEQFAYACRVCRYGVDTVMTNVCEKCRMEKEPGFVFDPDLYIKMCRDLNKNTQLFYDKEKYFYDGEKFTLLGVERGGGKIFHLEQMLAKKNEQLKFWKEDREYWKSIAESMIQRVVELSQMYIDKG